MSDRNFRVILPGRCLELLRSQVIGRVAWASDQDIQILSATYGVHRPGIIFRSAPYGFLAELRDHDHVAFEVDTFAPVAP